MTQYLPPNLLALFAARDPIAYMPPVDKLPHEKKSRGYLGVGKFLSDFEDPKDTPPPKKVETRQERLERRRREKAEQVAYKLEREIALWDPQEIKNATEDPFRTLFVARINYDTSESKLRREFEIYGPIKKIVMITDQETGKPKSKGYAFIEYEHEHDMHAAYKHADGKKIDGKRVLVDVERARTVKGWLPRRLGGGLGGTRRGGNDVNIKHSGREDNKRERERYRLEREREDRENARAVERGRFGAADSIRRRSQSRDRLRERERERSRRSRSRSRERRKRRGSRERDYDDFDRRDRREKDRERERERDRKKKRSKSRERDSSRERRERKRDRRDKERDRDRSETKERKPDFRDMEIIKIKEEPVDDGYPTYPMNSFQATNIKRENDEEHEEKYRPPHDMFSVPPPSIPGRGGGGGGENGQNSNENQQSWWR
uniref:U1 small nuclear ribonucleoprotein 70 kDa n=2 Tax=Glossina TaxID=44049 RepID=A0A1B0FF02_GLOMM